MESAFIHCVSVLGFTPTLGFIGVVLKTITSVQREPPFWGFRLTLWNFGVCVPGAWVVPARDWECIWWNTTLVTASCVLPAAGSRAGAGGGCGGAPRAGVDSRSAVRVWLCGRLPADLPRYRQRTQPALALRTAPQPRRAQKARRTRRAPARPQSGPSRQLRAAGNKWVRIFKRPNCPAAPRVSGGNRSFSTEYCFESQGASVISAVASGLFTSKGPDPAAISHASPARNGTPARTPSPASATNK